MTEDRLDQLTRKFEEILFDVLELDKYCDKEHIKETPKRIAKMWLNELLQGVYESPDETLLKMFSFENKTTDTDQVIAVRDIEVKSLCSHHFMPFFGTCNIAYIPSRKILGLSKFSRIVRHFSRKPQVQEKLTEEIALFIFRNLQPKVVGVSIRAIHLCMRHRGVESNGSMITHTVLSSTEYRHLEDEV
ncbi:MAG: hypothetical protein DRG33_03900, partial [Deltaproteobacteria bacterium]